MSEKSIADFIKYSGNPDAVLIWELLPVKTHNALNRMFSKFYANEEFWVSGVTYNQLSQIPITDLYDTNHIGRVTATNCLIDLNDAFAYLETQPNQKLIINKKIDQSAATNHDHLKIENDDIKLEEYESIDPVDEAKTIEELQDAIIFHFNDYIEIDDRVRAILHGRHPGLMRDPRTLDDIAKEFGVTRERIRQIESKFLDLELGFPKSENELLKKSIEILESANSFEEFTKLMCDYELADYEYIGSALLKSCAKILGLQEYVDKIEKEKARINEISRTRALNSNQVRKYRNKIGLIDIEFACNKLDINRSQFQEIVQLHYPRSLVFNNACLARTIDLDTAFENVIFKQLKVASNLNDEDLLIGIKRHAAYRGENTLVADDDLIGIIKMLAGSPANLETLNSNMLSIPSLSNSENWILSVFNGAPNGVLHRTEVVEAAIKSGFDFTSAGVYLSTSMLIRPLGGGNFRLIGVEVNPDQLKFKNKLNKIDITETKVNFSFEGNDLRLVVIPNTNSINGVIFPPKAIKEMLKNHEFKCACSCGALVTSQVIKVTETNFLLGFSAIFKHGINQHGFSIGEEYNLIFNFDKKTCELQLIDS